MQQVDDPPYLSVGTEVSAKYKGAFCEAKVRKVVRNIKCKVAYKQGLGTGTVSDEQIKSDLLRVGGTVEVKHPDRRELVEATIIKIQDCSQYTVVFDDGDITTLRRSALCLKSGRHFNESETLDQLPLTHPEHFGNPVIGGRRGRRNVEFKKNVNRSRHMTHMPDDSSEEDDEPVTTKQRVVEKEEHIGKVVCVENTETKKKSSKENYFPALVVAPTAQDTVRIRVKDEYLVRSFKDGRYYTVPKKEAIDFPRDKSLKQDNDAVQAVLEYLDNDSLPPHWDRDVLFGLGNCSSEFEGDYESDTSDDEPREEKDHFVAQLYKYMDDRGTPLNKGPSIVNKDVDLYRLFRAVQKLGGYNRVTTQSQWKQIATRLGYTPTTTSIQNLVKQAYKKFLLPFEEFDRKLGCTMVAHPRANRIKGRSLVRANSVASPKPEKEIKSAPSTAAEESENTSESGAETLKSTKRKLSTSSGKVKSLVEKYEEKVKEETKEIKKEIEEIVVPTPAKEVKESKKSKDAKEMLAKEIKLEKDAEAVTTPAATRNKTVKEEVPQPSTSTTAAVKKDKVTKRQSQNQTASTTITTPTMPSQPPTPTTEDKKNKKRKVDLDATADKVEKEKSDPNDFPIEIGDKLKVYYHAQKVTYEAKVIEIGYRDGVVYLVHYTGWNTRYDEWVPKSRVAENLTNNKTNKRARTGSAKTDARSNSVHSDKTSGPSMNTPSTSKNMSKRGRGSSRGDSQPPRSTTPSSVASNSSRTKSPATPAQRRTTRAQPNQIRRTSNNTDISSLPDTDTDTDSDEPVKKPSNRKIPLLPRTAQPTATSNVTDGNKTTSNPSSEEDSATSKGRDFDLNQIRSELKGFKELKSPSPDTEVEETRRSCEKKFEFPTTSNTESGDSVSQDITKAVTSDSKTSTDDTSSESDSYGDDDSQFSDKTTTLENLSEKLKEKYKAGKLDTDVFKNKLPPPTMTAAAAPNDLVDKVATLKPSGIEKIIKNSLAEKSKALPEKMTMKALCEKSPLKQVERAEKEDKASTSFDTTAATVTKLIRSTTTKLTAKTEKVAALTKIDKPVEKTASVKNTFADKLAKAPSEKLVGPKTATDKFVGPKSEKLKVTEKLSKLTEKSQVQTKPDKMPPQKLPIARSAMTEKQLLKEKMLEATATATQQLSDLLQGKNIPSAEMDKPSPAVLTLPPPPPLPPLPPPPVASTSQDLGDIYEFKEPEPFEFDTVKKLSPDIDKKKKKFVDLDQQKSPPLSPTTASAPPSKKSKRSPIKEAPEKKPLQIIEDPLIDSPPAIVSPTALIPPPKIESIFDSLRKSPSFNLNLATQNMQEELFMLNLAKDDKESTLSSTPTMVKPTFISSFVEASPEETLKIFESKPSELPELSSDDDKPVELETVKKILLSDEVFELEPPKIDKPSSIADKVLKALNQQKQESSDLEDLIKSTTISTATATVSSNDPQITTVEQKPRILSPIFATVEAKPTDLPEPVKSIVPLPEPPKIELPAIIKKDIETQPKKPVLSSPEHKLDILESIAPKNNDLSETIQKLESVIQQTADMSQMSDDSSDSTDSEQRLIIEDESQSSETQNDFTGKLEQQYNAPAVAATAQKTDILKKQMDHKMDELVKSGFKFHQSDFFATNEYKPTEKQQKVMADTSIKTAVDLVAAYNKIPNDPATLLPAASVSIHLETIKKKDEHMAIDDADKKEASVEKSADSTHNEPLSLLLCEETIPGSPAPTCPKDIVDNVVVKKSYDNMFASPHPTGADIKSVPMDIEMSGSGRDLKDPKMENVSPNSSLRDSLSQDDSSEDIRKIEQDGGVSPRKRRRSKKPSECDSSSTNTIKRRKGPTSASRRNTGSDSEDNSDAVPSRSSTQRPSRPCQYNFLVQLDPALNSNQRISILNKKIQDLRKTYNMIKAELASIDRRRKKLRRREREIKKNQLKQMQASN